MKYWYAVQSNEYDDDWGTGSYELKKAKRMAEVIGREAKIAVIDEGDGHDPICVHELRRDKAGDWRDEERRYY